MPMKKPTSVANQERVRRMLRKAFVTVQCPDSFQNLGECGPINHEFCVEFRRNFYNYEAAEIQYVLPYVLEDMMDTRTGDDIDTDDAERLVLQLDPFWLDDATVREIQNQQFANFTFNQRQAVCEWLRFARTWHDLRRFTHWVDAAIRYWCNDECMKQDSR
jgi:hypothetical protein